MIDTWPGWKNIKLLGKGSYGAVYEIQKEEFGKTYKAALKVISIPTDESEMNSVSSLGLDDESITDYFYSSVEAVSQECELMHSLKGITNIVSYEDHKVIKREDAFGWDILIRMELLTPLEKMIRTKELSVQDICRIGIDICTALDICEKRNIVHRDIKPANIFVNDFGDYKLGDFGIARTLEKTSGNLSQKGTYNYMAPEVFKGEKYGKTVDIYSLGIVLYRLLNKNRLPFVPEGRITVNTLNHAQECRMGGQAIPPMDNCDPILNQIIMKAIEFDPNNRYQCAMDFKDSLETYLRSSEDATTVIKGKDIENNETVIISENVAPVKAAPPSNPVPPVAPQPQQPQQPQPQPVYAQPPVEKKGGWIKNAILGVLLVAILGVGGYLGYTIYQNSLPVLGLTPLTVEFGDNVSLDAKNFVDIYVTKNCDLNELIIETDLINNSEKFSYNPTTKQVVSKDKDALAVGTYTITIKTKDDKCVADTILTIEDTTPPEFIKYTESINVDTGTKSIKYKDYFKAEDKSECQLIFDDSALNLNKKGTYDLIVTARDEYGNETKRECSIIVKKKKEETQTTTTQQTYTPAPAPATYSTGNYIVTLGTGLYLNVRTSPSTAASSVGKMYGGDSVYIDNIQYDGSYVWGHYSGGWVCITTGYETYMVRS